MVSREIRNCWLLVGFLTWWWKSLNRFEVFLGVPLSQDRSVASPVMSFAVRAVPTRDHKDRCTIPGMYVGSEARSDRPRFQTPSSFGEFPLSVSESTAERYQMIDPDVRLMLQVRDDNAAAFEELVLRYQNRLISVLEHLAPSRGQAEDLAQEVFLRVFRARKQYEPGARFSTWLFTIANNVASNAIRTVARRKEVHLEEGMFDDPRPLENMAVAKSGLMPTRQLDKQERATMVRAAIDGLGERQRMALLLSKFEGLSYAEIAEIMEMTPKAVKSLLSRARENLRVALEPYIEEGSSTPGSATNE
jgi:RNA polymerase sigma-70 factor, ECF subfamily